jgi:hypothetical protein
VLLALLALALIALALAVPLVLREVSALRARMAARRRAAEGPLDLALYDPGR